MRAHKPHRLRSIKRNASVDADPLRLRRIQPVGNIPEAHGSVQCSRTGDLAFRETKQSAHSRVELRRSKRVSGAQAAIIR
mgnify:CR=1 FL=1